jgi:phosphoglucomutase
MKVSPHAGKPAEASMLVNVPRLVTACYTEQPDPSVPEQRVAFGASAHRGSICLYREHKKAPDRSDKS